MSKAAPSGGSASTPTRATNDDIPRVVVSHLLSAPASVRLPHILRRFDGRNILQHHVYRSDDADDRPGNDPKDVVVEENRANKDVEDSTADKGEQERGVFGHVGWYLILEQRNRKTKNNHVTADDDALKADGKELTYTTEHHYGADDQVHEPKDVREIHGCNDTCFMPLRSL